MNLRAVLAQTVEVGGMNGIVEFVSGYVPLRALLNGTRREGRCGLHGLVSKTDEKDVEQDKQEIHIL